MSFLWLPCGFLTVPWGLVTLSISLHKTKFIAILEVEDNENNMWKPIGNFVGF